mgnify:FL=1
MARRTGLIASIVLVLAVHAALLHWLASVVPRPDRLLPMATPVFTRLLQPQTPPVAVTSPSSRPNRPATRPETAQTAIELIATPASDSAPASTSDAGAATVTVADMAPAAMPVSAPEAATAPETPATDPLAGWPVDTRIRYRLSGWFRGELQGEARVQWQREDSRYQVRIEIDIGPFVSLRMTSQGDVTPAELQPAAYAELRGSRRRHARLGPERITFEDGRELPRPAGVQDTASQFVALSHRFASGQQPLAVGEAVRFWMARPGAVDEWTYDVVERVPLQTPTLGVIDAFHLKPRPIANPRGNITAEMWFAPALQYLPVRIRINQGSEIHLDLLVDRIEQK